MDRTADKSTSLRTPWREALKRAGSFDELRPYLHTGQIPAHHDGLYALSDSNQHSGPGILRPEKWAHAYEDRAGRRVIFITDEVVSGQLVREQVFAYTSGIEFDSAAFDTFFPVAGLPPAEHQESRRRAAEVDAAAPGQVHPGPLTTQAEPAASPPTSPRKNVSGVELRNCILKIKSERPDNPPDEEELRTEVETRLVATVARDRIRQARDDIAPEWKLSPGRPRKSTQ